MEQSEALEVLNSICQKPVFALAFQHLKPGTELALRLDDRIEFALFKSNNMICVEERQSQADVEFVFNSESVRQLQNHEGQGLSSFGIALAEQILAGHMRVRIRGSLFNVLRGGYIKMILAAGPEFLEYLALHGLTSTAKIVDLFRSLKK